MIRSPLGLRIAAESPVREGIERAARAGAKGVVLDAIGDLSPDRLSETGRREILRALGSRGLALIGLGLPTRRGFDTLDQLEDRLKRADRAFAMAFELRAPLVLVQAGAIPSEEQGESLSAMRLAIGELDKLAANRGVILALELGSEDPGRLLAFLGHFGSPHLAASVDPSAQLGSGKGSCRCFDRAQRSGWHAYAGDLGGSSG